MKDHKLYTISAYTENSPGVLHRLVTSFTKRKLNIESLTVSETSEEGTSVITITLRLEAGVIPTIIKQIERMVEVKKAFASEDDELIFKEVGLVRVKIEKPEDLSNIEEVVTKHNASVVYVDDDSAIIQTIGSEDDTQVVCKMLESFGVFQFIRSGRIALRKQFQSIYS